MTMATMTTKKTMKMKSILREAKNRAWLSITTIPGTFNEWFIVCGIALFTTLLAGVVATLSNFVDPIKDFNPPSSFKDYLKAGSAFIFPSLLEEIFWRGILLPHPSTYSNSSSSDSNNNNNRYKQLRWAGIVLVIHVLLHPLAGYTIWPRGLHVFADPRFLMLADIVLGGTTIAYLASGGSIWAATLTHGLSVVLWRDFFNGESKLMMS